MNSKILSKFYTREHSLFYAYAWWEGNCKKNSDWLDRDITDILFLRPGTQNMLEVWYALSELDAFRKGIQEKITEDIQWFDNLCDNFERDWAVLHHYYSRDSVLSGEELKDFYSYWTNWWTPMAIMIQIPEIDSLPESIRKKAEQLRAQTQEYSDKGDEIYFRYIQDAYPQYSKYMYVLIPDEVFSGSLPDSEILKARMSGWFLTSDSFGELAGLPDALRRRGFELEKIDVVAKEIKGSVAYKGKVRGIVKVIQSVDAINTIAEGDVLVTPMTDPRYIPALKKISALVTDEGGLTCHAAIVSREMKIPCIIGTKVATKILKDGDEVEVDAERGIVTLIS